MTDEMNVFTYVCARVYRSALESATTVQFSAIIYVALC